jgi:putative DNA primase/helicase
LSTTDLIHLVEDIQFFTSAENRPYARLPNHCVPLRSTAFRDWLFDRCQAAHLDLPGSHALSSVLNHLEARTVYDTPNTRVPVALRVGSRKPTVVPESLLIDLAGPAGTMVEITGEGWSVVPNHSAAFESSAAAVPMPAPIASNGHPLETLQTCLNLSTRADWLRCLTWLLAAFRPDGPYPILILQGPSNSGKSTAARLLRTLVDPAAAPLAVPPASVRELVRVARNHWVVAFDHVRSLGPNVTVAICRLTSGMGIVAREQLASRGVQPFEQSIARPILLTAAPGWTCPPDLASRALVVNLQPVPPERHRNQVDILDHFTRNLPAIFGALCTALSASLGRAAQLIQAAPGSHCSDALAWITAAAPALPASPAELRDACTPPPPSYPLLDSIVTLLDTQPTWTGSATDLLQQLHLPLTPQRLSRQLAGHRAILLAHNIHLNFRRIHGGDRRIHLSRPQGDDKTSALDTSPPAPPLIARSHRAGDEQTALGQPFPGQTHPDTRDAPGHAPKWLNPAAFLTTAGIAQSPYLCSLIPSPAR